MITVERLREALRYDPETGLFFWRVRTSRRVNMGKPAGNTDAHGYRRIQIDGRRYKAHRLAWLHVYGDWPSKHIDHINCDKADNRLINLREATPSENQYNRGKQSSNTSGHKGVHWNASARKWQAQIKIGRKNKHLGYFDCKTAAHAVYCDAAAKYHGEFARLE